MSEVIFSEELTTSPIRFRNGYVWHFHINCQGIALYIARRTSPFSAVHNDIKFNELKSSYLRNQHTRPLLNVHSECMHFGLLNVIVAEIVIQRYEVTPVPFLALCKPVIDYHDWRGFYELL